MKLSGAMKCWVLIFCFILPWIPSGETMAGSHLSLAPYNPEFIDVLSQSELGGITLGYLPPPVKVGIWAGKRPPLFDSNSFPSQYDLRTLGKLSPVRDQGSCGSCWTFATYGSLESFLLPGEPWDFSENNLKNTHGFDWSPCAGGNYFMATAYLARWSGPILETDDPYNPSSGYSPPGLPPRKHVQEVLFFPDRFGSTDNDLIKWAVMNYGGVATTMYWDPAYYNSTNKAYYFNGTIRSNHAVVIVGWDDNYDRMRFSGASGTPPGNGAFIVRNSWGSYWGEGGYFYISYYDGKIGKENAVFQNAEPTLNYGRIYQYDPLGWTDSVGYGSETAWFANVFTATETDTIAAVSFYSSAPSSSYQVFVNPDFTGSNFLGSLVASGTFTFGGYHTVPLNSLVSVSSGHRFCVAVKLTTPGDIYPIPIERRILGYSSNASANPGESYTSSSGAYWTDLTDSYQNANVCLKAVSQAPSVPPSLSFYPSSFTFTATQGGGNPPYQTLEVWNSGGGSINWTASENSSWLSLFPTSGTSSGEPDQITVSVDISGLASGTYTATITLTGEGASNSPQYLPVTLQVNPPPKTLTSLDVSPLSWTFTSSTPKQFAATAYFSDSSSQDVTSLSSWSSDNPSVASVDSSGLVTPLSSGSTYIRASYSYSGVTKSAQSSITVDFPHIVSITSGPTASPSTIPSGGSTSLSVSASDSLGHSLTWNWSWVSSTGGLGQGSFSNTNSQNPTWTAPANTTGSSQTVTLKVKASCSSDPTKYAEGTVNVTVEPIPPLTISNFTASPSSGVSSWNPVFFTASGSEPGYWSLKIFDDSGIEVTNYGLFAQSSSNPGVSFQTSWTPTSFYKLTGNHLAVLELRVGERTATATISFSVYNFPMVISKIQYYNSSWVPIPEPKAGQPFFIAVEVNNISGSTVPLAFVPVMIGDKFVGASGASNLSPGQSFTSYIQANIISAGNYLMKCFVWSGPSGYPIAEPYQINTLVTP